MDIVYKFQVVPFGNWNDGFAEDCLFSTAMIFVFLLLTMSSHFWQYACRFMLPKETG